MPQRQAHMQQVVVRISVGAAEDWLALGVVLQAGSVNRCSLQGSQRDGSPAHRLRGKAHRKNPDAPRAKHECAYASRKSAGARAGLHAIEAATFAGAAGHPVI